MTYLGGAREDVPEVDVQIVLRLVGDGVAGRPEHPQGATKKSSEGSLKKRISELN